MTMQLLRSLFLFILVYLVLHNSARAQFNDSIQHYVHFSSTGIINKTNQAKSYLLTNRLNFSMKKKKISLNSNNSFLYGLQQDVISNRDFGSSLDFNIYPYSKRFYYWGLVNYDKSVSLKINNRIQMGGGAAYNFVDKPDFNLNISEGILYEKSDLKLTDSTNKLYETVRNSLRIRYKLVVKEIIVLNGTNIFQNSFSDGNDYLIQSVNSLAIKLRKWLSFTTAVTYNKIQRTNRENLLLTFGLTAEKYF